jgi:hypothetical protein
MTERDFAPAFRVAPAVRGAGLARRAAEVRGLDLPLIEAIAPLRRGRAGHADKRPSATYLMSTPNRR